MHFAMTLKKRNRILDNSLTKKKTMPGNPAKTFLLFFSLLTIALTSVMLSLQLGSIHISTEQLWQILNGSDHGMEARIVSELRWPRTATAFVTGSLLALSGVLMQVLLRNPLADPYILGISGGAATAALFAISIGISSIWLQPVTLAGAAIAMLLVYFFARLGARQGNSPLLLTGVILAAGWGALINLLLILADNHTVHAMLFWLMGDLSYADRVQSWHLLLLIFAGVIAWWFGRDLNLLLLGEAKAFTLGSPVKRVRIIAYSLAAMCTATAVSLAGTVGFIGLIIPHMMRKLTGSDHRLLIPASVLAGGSLLTIADMGARTFMSPQQLPVGVITAMLGVPIFLYLLIRR